MNDSPQTIAVWVGEWGRLQHGLFLQSGMSYSDDIHAAHAKSAPPHPSWMKSGTCDHSFYKKNYHGKKVLSCLREAL